MSFWTSTELQSPVVLEVPHAGLAVPELDALRITPKPQELIRDSDPYVDAIAAQIKGCSRVVAEVSRQVVDLNRAADDVDAAIVVGAAATKRVARGVVWYESTRGRPFPGMPMPHTEFEARMQRTWRPYHRTLQELIEAIKARHGKAIVLALHSMPSLERKRAVDIVVGTRYGRSAARVYREAVEQALRTRRLRTRRDDPYAGGFTTAYYGRPLQDVHTIQLEISRGYYMNERTLMPDEPAIEAMGAALQSVVNALDKVARHQRPHA